MAKRPHTGVCSRRNRDGTFRDASATSRKRRDVAKASRKRRESVATGEIPDLTGISHFQTFFFFPTRILPGLFPTFFQSCISTPRPPNKSGGTGIKTDT